MIEIRRVTKADLPKLLWNEDQLKWKELDEKHFQEVLAGTMIWLIAEFNNEVVGRIKALPIGQTGKPTLFALRVREYAQKRGIGTSLIKAAEKALKERGAHQILISVEKDNKKALKLYQNLGYKTAGDRIDHWSYFLNGEEIKYDLEVLDLEKELK